jgi:hypothetical protein
MKHTALKQYGLSKQLKEFHGNLPILSKIKTGEIPA